jgi:hypothetical protein
MPTETSVPKFLRHTDLVERKITTSWPKTRHMQQHYGFPLGRLLGPNTRVWTVDEVADWLNSRPTSTSAHVMARAEKSIEANRARRHAAISRDEVA